MKNILINPATPIVLYTAYKVLNLAKQAKRLNSFTDKHYKPSGQNFFGSFAEFIKTMRMSIEDGSISEEFLFWRQRKFKESQNSAFPGTWIFKTLPWRQLMYVADPKLVEMMGGRVDGGDFEECVDRGGAFFVALALIVAVQNE